MSDIYKFAAQQKLRFPSKQGNLTVEQLFQLPLLSQTGADDLNTIAKTIDAQLSGASVKSFVEEASTDPVKYRLSVALDVVKDVIATKQAENKAARLKLEKGVQRKKILDAIAAKNEQALSSASVDDLNKQLAALDD